MADPLSALLARQPVVVADGAMGTSLFALGLETGASPELWNLEQPERVRSVHQSFVDAGSDLILTNSFGANRYRLSLHGAQAQVGALNRAAARLARAVADDAGRPVLVAGSMGPTGEIFAPIGALDRQAGEAAFAEQAEALADGGCDVLWIETISAVEELEAAVAGAARTGLPVVATMTFDTHGRTMMGVTTAAAMRLRERLAVRPVAFGANCGIGPAQLVESVLGLARAADAGDVIVAKGNCGVPHYREGADPLRRHAGGHGGLCLSGARCGRAGDRRLLRHHRGPRARHGPGAGQPPAGPAPGTRGHRGSARPAGPAAARRAEAARPPSPPAG